MLRILPVLAALAAATPALAVERQFSVTDFDKVEVSGPYQVTLATGRPSSARASGSLEALDAVQVDVQGSTLRVRPNRAAWGGYPGKQSAAPATFVLSTTDLRAARVNGAGVLTIDKVRSMRLDLAVAGSGALLAPKLETDTLSAFLTGSGRLQLGGKTKTIRAQVHGSGDLQAEALRADDATIASDTAGTVTVSAARTANIVSAATGDVEVIGSPACTVKATGTGRVHCGRN